MDAETGYEPDPDDYDQDDREDDPEDADVARDYAEHWEHREQAHGGGECDCGPTLRQRLAQRAHDARYRLSAPWHRARRAAAGLVTVRLGTAEVTVRLRPRGCSACSGKGWFYTLSPGRDDDRPPGHNGVALCGCGAAIGKLAETRRDLRRAMDEPPF